mgnify:CR=1 FL=1
MKKSPSASGDDNPDDPGANLPGPGGGTALVSETAKPALRPPAMYKVLLLNDDFTPMDFVVEILEGFFSMNREQATRVMLTVHTQGKAVCGIYSRDVAETKVTQVIDYARRQQHPLMAKIEQA